MGTLHLYDGPSGTLRLGAHRNLPPACVEFFSSITASSRTPCTEAIKRRQRVLIEDIAKSPLLKGTPALDLLQAAGVRAVQSTPVVDAERRLLAVFSTHWVEAHRPEEGAVRLLDLVADRLLDLIQKNVAPGISDSTGRSESS
jgi:GAF domain-containing protein